MKFQWDRFICLMAFLIYAFTGTIALLFVYGIAHYGTQDIDWSLTWAWVALGCTIFIGITLLTLLLFWLFGGDKNAT